MQRLRTVTSLDISTVAGHHAMPAALLFLIAVWLQGWSGDAMALGKLPVPGRPTIWMIVGQGPISLAVGAGGVVNTFLLSSILSLLFLPLSGRRPDID